MILIYKCKEEKAKRKFTKIRYIINQYVIIEIINYINLSNECRI